MRVGDVHLNQVKVYIHATIAGNHLIISFSLVAGQMILIALLASPISQLYQGSALDTFGVLLIGIAVAIATWAFSSMQSGTFTVLPEPTSGASFTQAGPYKHVRHPMYSAVIIGGLGATLCHADVVSVVQLMMLIVLLVVKLQREERYLTTRYATYEHYRTHTKALVPYFF